ncbi:MAG: histidine phosphatase family protein, partial [Candidatus Omnitrophica bacterium]|nr:histidine phosphatase family protein [Candidatus Omnitrophota bacterium]
MKKEESQKNYSTLYLVRHGETDWNVKGLIQGHSDIPLNKKGEAQARQLEK